MVITINDQTKLADLQMEFNSIYPYLWIDFYTLHLPTTDHFEKILIEENKTFAQCSILRNGIIIITPFTKVSDLVQQFRKTFNIIIQVLRKSGKAWIEITGTDGWTLVEQNNEGKSLSSLKR